ncbi:unnamed protein product, partial [Durusdinium trenchii]|uniref:HECT-type E3 ubiquitin transferase n=2 Tax=Durusdinium trenchii TaxID=1381693 RepID=A0ABP0KYA2_9DINO
MADATTSEDVVMGGSLEKLILDAKAWPPEAFELFRKLLQNVLSSPEEAKFRKLKLSNARINALLAEPGAEEGFEQLGWVRNSEALELPALADLRNFDFVLKGTSSGPPGELVPLTVLRGALKSKLELPCNTLFSELAARIEQSDALGRIPRKRQRLLVGVPPKPLAESYPQFASMTISELGLKAFKLEDTWEEMVADLRALRASFESLASVLSCKKTLSENFDFLLDSAKALLKSRAMLMDETEMCMARRCFSVLWPPGVDTLAARLEHCVLCTPLAIPQKSDDGETTLQFPLQVERADLFNSALSQIQGASIEELRKPLQVTFVGEAAEDAGGPRREFFNDFGRSCTEKDGIWRTTPVGSLTPVPAPSTIFHSCGRIYGLALCQAENAAQEQRVRENATIQELLAAVTGDEETQQQQKLLVGASLSRPFLRCVQADVPESLEDLQTELNAEQSESAPDFRGSAAFITSSLHELGLEGQLTFSHTLPDGRTVELKPGGSETVVTDATKLAWLKAVLRSELVQSIEEAAKSFRLGVCEAAGAAYLVLLSAGELQQEWSGLAEISDDNLRLWQERSTICPARKQQAAWFFEVLWAEEWRASRPKVLKFTTGSDRWPSEPKSFTFYVEPMDGGDELLPRAMTCGNMLQLPSYSSKEQLQRQLLKACDLGLSMQLV